MKISINIQSYKRCGQVDTWVVINGGKIWVHDFEAQEYEKEYGTIDLVGVDNQLKSQPIH